MPGIDPVRLFSHAYSLKLNRILRIKVRGRASNRGVESSGPTTCMEYTDLVPTAGT